MKDRIIFKLSTELKEQLKQEARERELTLSAYIKAIIAERKK
jgi:hypothetical protein